MKALRTRNVLSQKNGMKRRAFLSHLAATALVATIGNGCSKDDDDGKNGIDLGNGDTGILNYVYSLKQVAAAFYIQVITTPYPGLTGDERLLITDIRDHEITHSEFLKAALGTYAIPELHINFSSVNFSNRDSVLSTAKFLEDLSVSAYNGAGQLFASADNLLIAGKIVSVEARHAAYIRDLLSYGSFADDTIIDVNGLDLQQAPQTVLPAIAPFLYSKLNGSNLPTT